MYSVLNFQSHIAFLPLSSSDWGLDQGFAVTSQLVQERCEITLSNRAFSRQYNAKVPALGEQPEYIYNLAHTKHQ